MYMHLVLAVYKMCMHVCLRVLEVQCISLSNDNMCRDRCVQCTAVLYNLITKRKSNGRVTRWSGS